MKSWMPFRPGALGGRQARCNWILPAWWEEVRGPSISPMPKGRRGDFEKPQGRGAGFGEEKVAASVHGKMGAGTEKKIA